MNVELPATVALAARDALASQLELMRARATCDRRYQPEVARLQHAHDAMTRALEAALRSQS